MIQHLDAAIRQVCPIHGVNSSGWIDFDLAATTQQRADAQAIVAEWDFAADDWRAGSPQIAFQNTRLIAALRATSADALNNREDRYAVLLRAVVLATLDEVNILRQWIAGFKTAMDAASSLSNLKTRVAALPNTPDRTAMQVRQAIESKISAGNADA